MRFYARNINESHFKTMVDSNNWDACRRAMELYSDKEKDILVRVYGLRDTLEDNVYETAKLYEINQSIIWDMMKEFERNVAKERGLI